MNLHNNKEVFNDLIIETSNYFTILPEIVKHDYYVSLALEELSKNIPGIIFKGGTSLSKCYDVINRYSEDIDLNYIDNKNLSSRTLQDFNEKIIANLSNIGFTISNKTDFKKRAKMNTVIATINDDNSLSGNIKVKVYLMLESYPIKKMRVNTFIGKYLSEIDREDLKNQFDLDNFEINTQDTTRTFIDKIFAICDYYERNEFARNSRHLYDLHKLLPSITFDDNFSYLFAKVKKERQNIKENIMPSAQDSYNIIDTLIKINEENPYKSDYENITTTLLFEKTIYNDVMASLIIIIDKLKKLDL